MSLISLWGSFPDLHVFKYASMGGGGGGGGFSGMNLVKVGVVFSSGICR